MKRKVLVVSLLVLVISGLLVFTQLTLFVVPRIGAVPEGKTLVILRLNKTQFIERGWYRQRRHDALAVALQYRDVQRKNG